MIPMNDTYTEELKKAYANGILMDYCGSADRTRAFSGLYEDYCGLNPNEPYIPETTTTTISPDSFLIRYGIYQTKYMDNIENENLNEIFTSATVKKGEFLTTSFIYPSNSAITPEERNAQTEEESAAYEEEYACGVFYVLPLTVKNYEIVSELSIDETSLFTKKMIVNEGVGYYLVYKAKNESGGNLIVLEPSDSGTITFDIKLTA